MAIVDSPEFKRWFKGSKLVNEAGEPLVVYHGSSETDEPWEDKDFYTPAFFTDNKGLADSYGHVRAYFLRLINPKFLKSNEDVDIRRFKKYDSQVADEGMDMGLLILVKHPSQIMSVNADHRILKPGLQTIRDDSGKILFKAPKSKPVEIEQKPYGFYQKLYEVYHDMESLKTAERAGDKKAVAALSDALRKAELDFPESYRSAVESFNYEQGR